MSALRIVHVLTHGNVTRGGAFQALLLAEQQLRRGHEVEVLCNAAPDEPLHPTFAGWRERGIPIAPYDMARGREVLRFHRFLKARRPDVLHVHRDTALLFAWLATTFAPPPAFVSQRGTTHPFRTTTAALAHRSPRVHRIIAVAEAVKDALVKQGVPPRRVDVVYGSFDVLRFDPERADGLRVRRELGLAPGQPLVVQVGQLNRKKSPRNFVRAAALARERRPDVVFALAGRGKQNESCLALARELGLGDSFRMLGFRTDVPDLYAAADVVVNSSTDSEGLTGAVREGLAMGKPVVATAVDGNPEVVKDGETGYLVPPRDPAAMADRVLRVLERPLDAVDMGRRGRALVLRLMHPEVRVAATERVYRAVLAENRRTRGDALTA